MDVWFALPRQRRDELLATAAQERLAAASRSPMIPKRRLRERLGSALVTAGVALGGRNEPTRVAGTPGGS